MTGEIAYRGAKQLARAIRDGETSAVDACSAALARIERLDPALNAVVTLDANSALAEAARADRELREGRCRGPLHGVPVTIKDMHRAAGLRATFGLPWFSRYTANEDATAVARLRDAGAIVLGKTNVPFAGYDWQTRHPKFGVTNNPWDPTRTCGGSSGGAAVAVAAGYVPLELGSDLGGSIRVPCHFCGVFGLKPTEGRVPTRGHAPPGAWVMREMLTIGPIARSVEDLRLGLEIIAGPDAAQVTEPPVPLDTPEPKPLDACRFAWTDSLCGVPVTADTRRTIRDLAQELARRGATVEQASPAAVLDLTAIELWGAVNGFEFAAQWPPPFRWGALRWGFRLGLAALAVGRSAFSRELARGLASSPRAYFRALARRDEWAAEIERFVERFDAWICPAAATPAFSHRRLPRALDVDGERVPYSLAQAAFACPFNVSGHPVASVPAGRSEDGLPIGVQLVGRRFRERALLDVAEHVAAVTGGFAPPELPVG